MLMRLGDGGAASSTTAHTWPMTFGGMGSASCSSHSSSMEALTSSGATKTSSMAAAIAPAHICPTSAVDPRCDASEAPRLDAAVAASASLGTSAAAVFSAPLLKDWLMPRLQAALKERFSAHVGSPPSALADASVLPAAAAGSFGGCLAGSLLGSWLVPWWASALKVPNGPLVSGICLKD